ncbi:MAG TPA: hypothetical protein DDY57_14105 [Franconibacter pulveris]|nr:hypothetical protein [Franconibacter pulveris]
MPGSANRRLTLGAVQGIIRRFSLS